MLKSDADKWNEYYDEAISEGHEEVTADFIADQRRSLTYGRKNK